MNKPQRQILCAPLLTLICLVTLPLYVLAKDDPYEADMKEYMDDVETNAERRELKGSGIIQAPVLPGPEFLANITSANCPIVANASLSIDGRDFGEREGSVIIAFHDQSFSCEIEKWTDTNVRCNFPEDMIMSFGRSPKEAVIWLRPARITPPEPGTVCFDCDKTIYYYSGEEGPRYVCTILPIPAACTGVDLVLNKIEARKWRETACAAKVWISQVCDGETTVDSFYVMFTEGEEDYAAGWDVRAGWQGPTHRPLESGWLVRGCGTITGIVDYLNLEREVDEGNNQCSVTISEDQDSVSQTCHEF